VCEDLSENVTTCPQALEKLGYSYLQQAQEAMGSQQAWAKGVVEVGFFGQLANQLFQVAFGVIVADRMGYAVRFSNVMQLDDKVATTMVSSTFLLPCCSGKTLGPQK
jgi:dynactin complex subunit